MGLNESRLPIKVTVDAEASLEGCRLRVKPLDLSEIKDLLNIVSDARRLGLLAVVILSVADDLLRLFVVDVSLVPRGLEDAS
jgi:hypothetical protein